MILPWRSLIAFLLMAAFAGCASNGDSAEDRLMRLTIAPPSELSALPDDERSVSVHFAKVAIADEGSYAIDVEFSENAGEYVATVPQLPPGRYQTTIFIRYPYAIVSSNRGLDVIEGAQKVPIAKYDLTIDVVVGQQDIIIDTAPADWSLDIDADQDGMSNINEILASANPFVSDSDGDGVRDGSDFFPSIVAEYADQDEDGVGDNTDNCRMTANDDQADVDGDGKGDVCDPDSDNDGLSDVAENELGTSIHLKDTDADGAIDAVDNCPLMANANQADADGDSMGDACDTDDDNDGYLDISDNCPKHASNDLTDTNSDGIGDICSGDDDGDGVPDTNDNCSRVSNSNQKDYDHDGIGDVCDSDADNDGMTNTEESNPGLDNNITDYLNSDTDGDGIIDKTDNCPLTVNAVPQIDTDGDGEGDACDCDPFNATIRNSNGIFVSTVGGNDTASGARNNPLKTIGRAIALAQDKGIDRVYVVQGVYNEQVMIKAGISLFGGFSLSNNYSLCSRALSSNGVDINKTIILGDDSPVVEFNDIDEETTVEGFYITTAQTGGVSESVLIQNSDAESAAFVTFQNNTIVMPKNANGTNIAFIVDNASPKVLNNVISAGAARHSIGVRIYDSPSIKLFQNTIDGGTAVSSATAIESLRSAPIVVNNIIFTKGGASQTELKFLDEDPSSNLIVRNNLIFGIQGEALDLPLLYYDYDPLLEHAFSNIAQVNGITPNMAANKGYQGEVAGLFTAGDEYNYRLKAGTIAENSGLNTRNVFGLQISDDHDFMDRTEASPDIGAFER